MGAYIPVVWAFALGALSASSLPLGSWLGLLWHPHRRLLGFLAAFGAGALLAALAVELIAPTVLGTHHEELGSPALLALLIGVLAGGLLFIVLDQLVNAKGGFLRKSASTMAYFARKKKERQIAILQDLSRVSMFASVPQAAVQSLVDLVRPVNFHAGEVLFEQEEPGEELFFIRQGRVQLFQDDRPFKSVEAGQVLGEMALLTGEPRMARAVADTGVHALMLRTDDFAQLRKQYPELDLALRELVTSRMEELRVSRRAVAKQESAWAKEAVRALRTGVEVPSRHDLRVAHQKHSGAPMAIWLGILLDGVPESFVIGTALAALLLAHQAAGVEPGFLQVIPYTLIAGLFLSNFPEALSSSVGMREQGMNPKLIFLLWLSLMLMTAAGAVLGYLVGADLPDLWVVGIEGLAAGAMLTMIAATMLPEAAHRGGPAISGFGTLIGFIAAISFKFLE